MKDIKQEKEHIFVDNYGEMLADINQMELVSFEEDGGYQGDYCAVLTDGDRLFYYIDGYGSCSGCDWLKDEDGYTSDEKYGKQYKVLFKNAVDYCGGLKPKYIVPKDRPLNIKNNGEHRGFEVPPYRVSNRNKNMNENKQWNKMYELVMSNINDNRGVVYATNIADIHIQQLEKYNDMAIENILGEAMDMDIVSHEEADILETILRNALTPTISSNKRDGL